jgi:hypothetical protein
VTQIAKALGVNRSTVRDYMNEYGIERGFTSLTDEELETILRELKLMYPNAGVLTILGHLHARCMRVPQDRVWRTLQRIDALGVAVRRAEKTVRQEYVVPRCNHLWHFDGHHKLIDWGIVFHGGVDGYNNEVCLPLTERLLSLIPVQIVSLLAQTNNRAHTVLTGFLQAVDHYGLPWRIRVDRGGENLSIAVYMITMRGRNRGSCLWGSLVAYFY